MIVLLLTGCADTQGPIERSRSDWKEFGSTSYMRINY